MLVFEDLLQYVIVILVFRSLSTAVVLYNLLLDVKYIYCLGAFLHF